MSDLVVSLLNADLAADTARNGRWVSVFIKFPPVEHPDFFVELRKVTAWRQDVAPWMLEDITPSPVFVVAADFTWLNRLRVWWLNIGRRAQARKLAARLTDEEILRRQMSQLSPLNVAHLSMQQTNTKAVSTGPN